MEHGCLVFRQETSEIALGRTGKFGYLETPGLVLVLFFLFEETGRGGGGVGGGLGREREGGRSGGQVANIKEVEQRIRKVISNFRAYCVVFLSIKRYPQSSPIHLGAQMDVPK